MIEGSARDREHVGELLVARGRKDEHPWPAGPQHVANRLHKRLDRRDVVRRIDDDEWL